MAGRISTFIEAHPTGWNHEQWLDLLEQLEQDGMDVSEPAVVGLELEHERMAWELQRCEVPGLGPKRLQALVDRYHTLWNLRQASATDIAEVKTIPMALANKVFDAIHATN